MLNFNDFEVLTFDCYGTLIDWESGLVNSLLPVLGNHKIDIRHDELLELYGRFESAEESGEYRTYREVLRNVLRNLGVRLGFHPTPNELDEFPESIKLWQPFPDTVLALKRLQRRFKLAVISNIDDDLFAHSAKHLRIPFDWVITAQQVNAYKPSLKNFKRAIEVIDLPTTKILHVAQSLYHDIAPAKSLGLATIWINRRHNREGFGATPASDVQPDLEFPDLLSFAERLSQQVIPQNPKSDS
jgi:2-haloacid dehalogenase